jgi:hypothetical protein
LDETPALKRMTPDEHQRDMRLVREGVQEIQQRINVQSMSDHDLLIRLSTQSEAIVSTLKDIKEVQVTQGAAYDSRLGALGSNVDSRLRTLEEARWKALGAASVLGALFGFLAQIFLKHS